MVWLEWAVDLVCQVISTRHLCKAAVFPRLSVAKAVLSLQMVHESVTASTKVASWRNSSLFISPHTSIFFYYIGVGRKSTGIDMRVYPSYSTNEVLRYLVSGEGEINSMGE
jgi:hypothetical protein